MISYAVVGHINRILAATDLAHSIGAVVTLDDGSKGAAANHLEAWRLTATLAAPWAAALEDDAQPVPGFLAQAEQALKVAPEPVVSMYLGRTRPKRWQERIAPAIATADRAGAHWLTATHVLHAVAVAMHASLREDWLDFAHSSTLPPDERLTAWCIARGHRVAYTHPSLVQHADGPTLVRHANTAGVHGPRKAWRTGTRDTWTDRAVAM